MRVCDLIRQNSSIKYNERERERKEGSLCSKPTIATRLSLYPDVNRDPAQRKKISGQKMERWSNALFRGHIKKSTVSPAEREKIPVMQSGPDLEGSRQVTPENPAACLLASTEGLSRSSPYFNIPHSASAVSE